MSNLEELCLYLSTSRRKRFIDGNHLTENIIDYLPLLNKFQFNICSAILVKDQIDLPSNADIEHSFKIMKISQRIFQVDYLHVFLVYHYMMNILLNMNFLFELLNHFHL